MAITFVAEKDTAESGSGTCSKPTGIASGDFMVATVAVYDTTSSITAPSGWTLQHTANDGNSRSLIYTKTAGASEPTSYTWSGGTYFDIAISGFHSSTSATLALDGAVSSQNGSAGVCPAVTATNTGEALYVSWVTDANANFTSLVGGNPTASVTNSVTIDSSNSLNNPNNIAGDGFACGHKILSASGTTGTSTWSTVGGAGMGTSLLVMESSGGGTVAGGGTLQANGALTGAGQIVAHGQTLQGNGTLAGAAQLVSHADALQGNGALSGSAQLVSNGDALQGNGTLAASAQIVAHGDILQGNGVLLGPAGGIVSGGGALQGNGGITATARIVAPGTLASDTALTLARALILAPATLVGNGVLTATAQLVAASGLALVGDGVLSANGVVVGQTVPGAVTLSDVGVAVAALSDVAVTLGSVSDLAVAVGGVSDAAVAVGGVSDVGVAVAVLSDV